MLWFVRIFLFLAMFFFHLALLKEIGVRRIRWDRLILITCYLFVLLLCYFEHLDFYFFTIVTYFIYLFFSLFFCELWYRFLQRKKENNRRNRLYFPTNR